jgi:hypothetical protein
VHQDELKPIPHWNVERRCKASLPGPSANADIPPGPDDLRQNDCGRHPARQGGDGDAEADAAQVEAGDDLALEGR